MALDAPAKNLYSASGGSRIQARAPHVVGWSLSAKWTAHGDARPRSGGGCVTDPHLSTAMAIKTTREKSSVRFLEAGDAATGPGVALKATK